MLLATAPVNSSVSEPLSPVTKESPTEPTELIKSEATPPPNAGGSGGTTNEKGVGTTVALNKGVSSIPRVMLS